MISRLLDRLTPHDRKVLKAFVVRVRTIAKRRDIKTHEALDIVSRECVLTRRPDSILNSTGVDGRTKQAKYLARS